MKSASVLSQENQNLRNRRCRNRNQNHQNRFFKSQPEPEPRLSLKKQHRLTFPQRNRQNRKPEPLELLHARSVAESNRTGAILDEFAGVAGCGVIQRISMDLQAKSKKSESKSSEVREKLGDCFSTLVVLILLSLLKHFSLSTSGM